LPLVPFEAKAAKKMAQRSESARKLSVTTGGGFIARIVKDQYRVLPVFSPGAPIPLKDCPTPLI
jgi:hypothetical protein